MMPMTDDPPAKAARIPPRLRPWAIGAFWIGVFGAVMYGLGYAIPFVEDVVGDYAGTAISYIEEQILPGALRDALFWLADDVLPPITPALQWMQAFGESWNGLLTTFGLMLSIVFFLLGLSGRSKK
jgi:hypothetical protein